MNRWLQRAGMMRFQHSGRALVRRARRWSQPFSTLPVLLLTSLGVTLALTAGGDLSYGSQALVRSQISGDDSYYALLSPTATVTATPTPPDRFTPTPAPTDTATSTVSADGQVSPPTSLPAKSPPVKLKVLGPSEAQKRSAGLPLSFKLAELEGPPLSAKKPESEGLPLTAKESTSKDERLLDAAVLAKRDTERGGVPAPGDRGGLPAAPQMGIALRPNVPRRRPRNRPPRPRGGAAAAGV